MPRVRPTLLLLAAASLAGCGPTKDRDEPAANTEGEAAPQASARPAAFAVCATCHSVEPGRHGLGPSLNGVAGKPAASAAGYAYSEPMRTSGLVWDAATLDRYLLAPQAAVPGTKMAFAGIKDESKRAEVIAYLATLK